MEVAATRYPTQYHGHVVLRRWLLRIHLYAGLFVAIYAILMGLTGAVLVFEDSFTTRPYPASSAKPISTGPSDIVALVRGSYPDWRMLSVTWPNDSCPYWMAYLLRGSQALEVFSDGAGVVGVRTPGSGWMGALKRVHVNLALGRAGRLLNGYLAGVLLLMAVSGVILWLPGKRLRWAARELHYAVGIAAAAFIALLAFTGMYFIWPQSYVRAADAIFSRSHDPVPPAANAPVLPVQQLAQAAIAALPDRPIFRIEVVEQSGRPVHVTFLEDDAAEFHRVSTVLLDPATGGVIGIRRLSERSFADAILPWFSALHFGVFGKLPIRFLWAALSMSLPVLSVTGFLMWSRKRRASKRRMPERPQFSAAR